MAETKKGVRVAVDNATLKFDALYDYRVPETMTNRVSVGTRVAVPFGNGNAPRTGIVLEIAEVSAASKEIFFAEDSPILDTEFVNLVFALKDYTFCTYFDAIKTILPKASRVEPVADGDGYRLDSITGGYMRTVYVKNEQYNGELTARQAEVVNAVCRCSFEELRTATGVTRATVNKLVEMNAILKQEVLKELVEYAEAPRAEIPPLTASQKAAYSELCGFRDKGSQALLFGITSSGKTLVYIKLIEDCVRNGGSALVLVPEIAIATQMIYRLKSLFGNRVGVIHSALSDTERQLHWLTIHTGQCDIVVGTRSAVFAPLRNLKLIIIDEEQDQAYSSDNSPRYSTSSIARLRAHENSAFLMYASATPSVETFYKAKTGKIGLVRLRERYNDYPLPAVKVVDMQNELLSGNVSSLSRYLKAGIDERIERGEQSILLLNRRGYRTVITCSECRAVIKCERCDVPVVLHKQTGNCICHYCSATTSPPEKCPVCGGVLRYTGIGTQRVEEELSELFPTARIARLDYDTSGGKHSVEDILDAFGRGEYDILVGTQMIAKGLDFPNVTLVGVQSVDGMLTLPSFRAYERAFSMLTQVIGRGGRASGGAEAVIQTNDPKNEIMSYAAAQDYEAFYDNEIVLRKANLYPPFCAICTIGFVCQDEKTGMDAANEFIGYMKAHENADVPLRIFGPTPFRVAMVNNMYRCKLTVKCRGDRAFRDLLRAAFAEFTANKRFNKVRGFADFGADMDY